MRNTWFVARGVLYIILFQIEKKGLLMESDTSIIGTHASGFSNSAVDRRFSTPVATAVDGNLSKVVGTNV